jgi:hypothetical protein
MAKGKQSGPSLFDLWEETPAKPKRTRKVAADLQPKQEQPCPRPEEKSTNGTSLPTTVLETTAPTGDTTKTTNLPDSVTTASATTAAPPASSDGRINLKQIIQATKTSRREPTEEQKAILATAQQLGGNGVLVVEAGAGAGKTTTLTMLEETLGGQGQYTAFNSALVKESKAKFKRASCNTTHSLAFRAVGKRFAHRLGGSRVRSEEVACRLGIDYLKIGVKTTEGVKEKTLPAAFLASQVMQAIRRFCQSADRDILSSHFKYLDGIDVSSPEGKRGYANNEVVREYLLPFAQKAWEDLSSPEGQLPFTHDCYVKIWELDNPVISTDYLLIDESQDLSPVFLSVLKQQKALIILVGDSAQQIYEWRGAVDALKAFPDAPRCQLSQSFRFGPAIADLANQVLDCLQEKTALRLKGLPSIPSQIAPIAQPVAILTRTNACAIQHLFLELEAGRRPFLVGGGADVVSFVEGAKALKESRSTSHPDLACFGSWVEVQEYVKQDEGEDLRLMCKLIDEFGCGPILTALKSMPEERNADVVISTAHKSKGREWDTVKLASDFPTRSKSSDPDLKLLYVALTRAKLVLDVSTCPFFTGEDAMTILRHTTPAEGTVSVPVVPTPSQAPPTTFSWSKGRDGGWIVRGPASRSGEVVEVVSKAGRSERLKLGSVIWEGEGVALYKRS